MKSINVQYIGVCYYGPEIGKHNCKNEFVDYLKLITKISSLLFSKCENIFQEYHLQFEVIHASYY